MPYFGQQSGQPSDASLITSGISSILTPLVQTGTSILMAEEQLKLQKEMLKAQQQAAQQPIIMAAPQASFSPLLIVGVIAMVLIILVVAMSGRSITPGGSVIYKKIIRKTPTEGKRKRKRK